MLDGAEKGGIGLIGAGGDLAVMLSGKLFGVKRRGEELTGQ